MNDAADSSRMQLDLFEETLQSLERLYQKDRRPWVVAYSGGKDSTAVLQLVVHMLMRGHENAVKPVFVIASDTRVEAPNVVAYLKDSLSRIERFAWERHLPLYTRLVRPDLYETFWVNLVGKGYPPPTRWFRWCTSKLKIKPARRVIEEITASHGSVILLLGTRRAESSERSRRMEERARTELGLNPHHEIPNALVATPIEHWSTDDVWQFLLTHDPAPWGSSHQFLFDLYRQANAGECPVVLDLNTPSCGGSRFGCWTCTVVKADKSMQGFIQAGETHLQPLAEMRDWLKEIRDADGMRAPVTRNGQPRPGPFTGEARQMILDRLLATEQAIGIELIGADELLQIQWHWREDFDYADSAFAIARKYGREVAMDKAVMFTPEEARILEEVALEVELDPEVARKLIQLSANHDTDYDQFGARAEYRRALAHLVEAIAQQSLSAVAA